jgi:hypothetical protein
MCTSTLTCHAESTLFMNKYVLYTQGAYFYNFYENNCLSSAEGQTPHCSHFSCTYRYSTLTRLEIIFKPTAWYCTVKMGGKSLTWVVSRPREARSVAESTFVSPSRNSSVHVATPFYFYTKHLHSDLTMCCPTLFT